MRDKKFYPDYLAEVVFTVLVCLELVFVTALLYPPLIGRQIDFTRPFQPLPEWYFLWIYQLVRYFPGDTVFVGALVVPLLCILSLMFLPFIDRDGGGRKKAAVLVAGLTLLVSVLTVLSLV